MAYKLLNPLRGGSRGRRDVCPRTRERRVERLEARKQPRQRFWRVDAHERQSVVMLLKRGRPVNDARQGHERAQHAREPLAQNAGASVVRAVSDFFFSVLPPGMNPDASILLIRSGFSRLNRRIGDLGSTTFWMRVINRTLIREY